MGQKWTKEAQERQVVVVKFQRRHEWGSFMFYTRTDEESNWICGGQYRWENHEKKGEFIPACIWRVSLHFWNLRRYCPRVLRSISSNIQWCFQECTSEVVSVSFFAAPLLKNLLNVWWAYPEGTARVQTLVPSQRRQERRENGIQQKGHLPDNVGTLWFGTLVLRHINVVCLMSALAAMSPCRFKLQTGFIFL